MLESLNSLELITNSSIYMNTLNDILETSTGKYICLAIVIAGTIVTWAGAIYSVTKMTEEERSYIPPVR